MSMIRKALRVLRVTTASTVGYFRNHEANPRRFNVLQSALEQAAKERCTLVHLPAGFFTVNTPNQWRRYVETNVAPLATRFDIGIAGGVDADNIHEKSSALPYYGFLMSREGTLRVCERQKSSRNPNSDDPVAATEGNQFESATRIFRVGEHSVALVICGEMHSPWNRANLRGKGLSAVLVCGHKGLGQGLVPTLEAVNRAAECSVLHVQHLANARKGAFHAVMRSGEHESATGSIVHSPDGWWRYHVCAVS